MQALHETKGRVGGAGGAAALLGINRTTLLSLTKKLGMGRRAFGSCAIDSSIQSPCGLLRLLARPNSPCPLFDERFLLDIHGKIIVNVERLHVSELAKRLDTQDLHAFF